MYFLVAAECIGPSLFSDDTHVLRSRICAAWTPASTLAGKTAQILKELRVRHSRRICAENRGFSFGSQRGYGESHRDAVIAEGIEFCAVQMLATGDAHAIRPLFHVRTHLTQIGRDRGNAVRLFYAQLLGVAHFDAVL